jgi:histidine triad (HIT) family protein
VSPASWPNNPGHVVVIRTQHFENIYDLPAEIVGMLHAAIRTVALALKAAYACDRVSTHQHNEPAGNQDAWHYHVHVFPRYAGDSLVSQPKPAGAHDGRRMSTLRRQAACLPGNPTNLKSVGA